MAVRILTSDGSVFRSPQDFKEVSEQLKSALINQDYVFPVSGYDGSVVLIIMRHLVALVDLDEPRQSL